MPLESMWNVKGQDHIISELSGSISQNKLSHAYLITGPKHIGKHTLAMELAQAVNCISTGVIGPCRQCRQCNRISLNQHSDVQVINIDTGKKDTLSRNDIGINEIRNLQRQINFKPYEGSCRVFIIDDADQMTEEASNALLKMLEEPPSSLLILLLAPSIDTLLTTVVSRCRLLKMRPLTSTEITQELMEKYNTNSEHAIKLARLSAGCLGWAITALEDKTVLETYDNCLEDIHRIIKGNLFEKFNYADDLSKLFRQNNRAAIDILHIWLSWWKDVIIIRGGASELILNTDCYDYMEEASKIPLNDIKLFIGTIMNTRESLASNCNPRIAFEVLMLALPKMQS